MSSIFSTLNINLRSLPNLAECLTDSSVQRFKFNLAGLLALLTYSVHLKFGCKAAVTDAELLNLYTSAAQDYRDVQVFKQTESMEQIIARCKKEFAKLSKKQSGEPAPEFTKEPLPTPIVRTVNDISAELLQANEPLLRSLYALNEPRNLAAELYAYFYQNAAEAGFCCFPAQRCSGLLGAWLAAKPDAAHITAGNFLLVGQPSFMLTFELPGTYFINDFIKDYVLHGFTFNRFLTSPRSGEHIVLLEDLVLVALQGMCPDFGQSVHLFSLYQDYDDFDLLDYEKVLPSLEHPNFQYFDAAFMLPLCGQIQDFINYSQYGNPLSPETARKRAELVMTEQALRCTQGRVISQVLLSELSGSAVQFKKFRRQLCADHLLKAVCQLPKNFYQPDIDPSALLFMTTDSADRSDAVTFIDLSGFDLKKNPEDWEEVLQILSRALNGKPTACSAAVSYSDINERGNILLPSIYCSDSNRLFDAALRTYGNCLLSDVAEIIRCQAADADGDTPMYEVQMSSIDPFGFINPAKVSKVINCNPDDPQILKQRLQENDIILAVKGAGIGTAAIAHHAGDNWLGSQYFVIIRRRPDAPLSVEELFFALRSDAVQAFAKTYAKGAKLPLLSAKTLSTMPLIAAAADKHDAKTNFRRLCELRDSIQQMTAEALSLSFSQVLPSSAEEDCASA